MAKINAIIALGISELFCERFDPVESSVETLSDHPIPAPAEFSRRIEMRIKRKLSAATSKPPSRGDDQSPLRITGWTSTDEEYFESINAALDLGDFRWDQGYFFNSMNQGAWKHRLTIGLGVHKIFAMNHLSHFGGVLDRDDLWHDTDQIVTTDSLHAVIKQTDLCVNVLCLA